MFAGLAALSTYALLKAGVPANDANVKRAFEFLYQKQAKPGNSMEASMVLLAVTATVPVEHKKLKGRYRQWARSLVDHLIEKRIARGWRYNLPGQDATPGGPEDLCSTGLAALALFSAHKKQHMNVNHGYWLWMLESAMDLAKIPRVGKHKWYREMAQQLIDRQEESGAWRLGGSLAPERNLDTCFAILFLSRACKGLIP